MMLLLHEEFQRILDSESIKPRLNSKKCDELHPKMEGRGVRGRVQLSGLLLVRIARCSPFIGQPGA